MQINENLTITRTVIETSADFSYDHYCVRVDGEYMAIINHYPDDSMYYLAAGILGVSRSRTYSSLTRAIAAVVWLIEKH